MRKIFHHRRGYRLAAALLFTLGWSASACADVRERVIATLDADSRAFTFAVPGTMDFRGSCSATVVKGGQTQELSSAQGRLAFPAEQVEEDTPCGRAMVTEGTLRFEKEKMDLLVRLGRIPGVCGLVAQVGVCNTGPAPISLVSLTPVRLEGQVVGAPAAWLVTALDASIKNAAPVVALDEIQEPFSVFEFGGFYCRNGKGFLFGPVGTPIAYVQASIAHKGAGKVSFSFVAEMSGVQVKPGETRWGQQVALLTEPPKRALARWAEWVALTHKARVDKGALSGWNSWSFHGHNVTGMDILAQVETVLGSAKRLRPGVMEIDAGYSGEFG